MRDGISISIAQVSRAFWERVEMRAEAQNIDFSAGAGPNATSLKDAYWLYCLANYYQPQTVCEIGTYRGRSTRALALGMGKGKIWTCDKDANDEFSSPNEVEIIRHHMMSSEMLKDMTEPVDLFFFDGRIQAEDIPHIARLSHEKTVYVLDDFEGLEKGVHNALILVDETKMLLTQNNALAVVITSAAIAISHQ